MALSLQAISLLANARAPALLLALVIALSALAAPTLATRLATNVCTSTNYEYFLSLYPASGWYYRGSGDDPYCSAIPGLSQYVCNIAGSPYCTDETKAQTCARATYPATCAAASRVFAVVLDSDCDYVATCEYRSTLLATPPTVAPAPMIIPGTPGATIPVLTPAATPGPPPVSLAPKLGDTVVLSAFALGSAEYACNSSIGYDNGTLSATLYNSDTGVVLGSLSTVTTVEGQHPTTFNLTNGTIVVDPSTSKAYPSPSSIARDGGYGSLNQQYYPTAYGTGPLVAVKFATMSDVSGGARPASAPCPILPFPATQTFYPWRVPYQATYNFFSAYTLP